jgi:hypothetical protein
MVDYVVGQWLELAPEAEHTVVVVVDMWVVEEEERSGVVGEADWREVIGGKNLVVVVQMLH